MELISKIFRRDGAHGDVGIEIEVEGDNLPGQLEYWRCEHDGSLRGNSMEYVLARPLLLAEAKRALKELDKEYKKHGTVVHDSGRAGVHVHVNCQGMNIIQLYNFMVLYLMFEDVLVQWCGEDRVGNLFCLRSKDAEFLIYALCRGLEKGKFRELFATDDLRYASMNVRALTNYGSLEFRAMRSTRDMEHIYKWAEALVGLRNAAMDVTDPTELIYQVSAGGEEAFLDTFLPTMSEDLKKQEGWVEAIREGMRRAQEVAFAGDWEALAQGPKRIVGGLEMPNGWDDDFPPIDT